MNDISFFSILKDDAYNYNSREVSRCYVCRYDNDQTHDISQITDNDPKYEDGNLFISNYDTARCKDMALMYNIEAIVNVSNKSYEPYTSNYCEFKLDDDLESKLFPDIDNAYNFIDKYISQGQNVLVHCMAGISRSVSYVIYYLMKKKTISFYDALDRVKNARAIAGPNVNFRRQLKKYQVDILNIPDTGPTLR
jgi:hypothetical protein